MSWEDRELRCVSCGQSFVWTAGEQSFFAEKRLPHEPKRCRACSRARRSSAVVAPQPAVKAPSATTCSQCGRPTTVPFQPSEGRPVFCKTCYKRRRGSVATGPRDN